MILDFNQIYEIQIVSHILIIRSLPLQAIYEASQPLPKLL